MKKNRFLFVDGLRGLSALAVCLFHIGRDFLEIDVLHYGSLGVTVFFVLSGYVISHSLFNKIVSGNFFLSFAIKRSIRLDPSYWVAIFLAIAVAWVPSLILDYQVNLPSMVDVLTHMFYLQVLAEVDPINVVFWTLCYEIQFYLVFCGLLFLINKLSLGIYSRNLLTFTFSLLFAVSLLWPLGFLEQPLPGLFINLWYLFLLGVFARWASASRFSAIVLGVGIAALLLAFDVNQYIQLVTGSVTAAILFLSMHLNKMGAWLNSRWVQYLGTISYSLYLVHDIVGLYVRDTGLHLTSKYLGLSSLQLNYFWCSIALGASMIVANILYRYVEYPSHVLSRKVNVVNVTSGFKRICAYFHQVLRKKA